jgi:hypothetical protein
MKRDPLVSPEAALQIEDRYDRQVSAIATQISDGPSSFAVIKAVGALVFFDLLRTYEVSRLRRTDHSRL